MQNQLRKALANEELLLFYQPKIDLRSGRVSGAEALLCWNHPDLGTVSPSTFIPVLEELGLMVPIGEWVVREACRQNKAWQSAGVEPINVAVNVSFQQFRQHDPTLMIQGALESSGLDPRHLTVELTESMIMENPKKNVAALHRLKEMGLKLSIDDFGTGYSSLGYLRRFPLDELKIDRSFLTDIGANADDAVIVEAIIGLARTLGLSVVAEGIETEQQLAFLRQRDCNQGQGYLLGKPLPRTEFSEFLTKPSNRPERAQSQPER